jgi:putative peptide zinc metalloprotease protein
MLCSVCRRQFPREASYCPACGAARDGAGGAFDLVLPDDTRIPIAREVTIGRARGNVLRIADPAVSRSHVRISPAVDGRPPALLDAGSSFGTWVDGRRVQESVPLHDDARISVGDVELVVQRRRGAAEAGRTLVVPAGASVLVSSAGAAAAPTTAPRLPQLRSGYALKRLDARESTRRWMLRDLVGGDVVRLDDADAAFLSLLDGRHSVAELSRDAERRLGPEGPARLALLLADLGVRGLLAGSSSPRRPAGGVLRVRQRTWAGAADLYDRLYDAGAWRLFTRTGLALVALVAVAGLGAFGFLVAARYGTPFVVARKLVLGGAVFVAGRLAVAALHESAHALTLASLGRRVGAAGVKLILVFPYVFVDTSAAWFEPRRRRMAVSAAGPVSDLTLGGAFALACLAAAPGTLRDVLFQLSFGAYVGALFNLNPLLERDGYHILVDLLDEPGLRRRALDQLRRRLAGQRRSSDSRLLARYGALALAWTLITVAFAVVMSLRYEHALAALVPGPAAWALIAPVWVALLALPLALVRTPRPRS